MCLIGPQVVSNLTDHYGKKALQMAGTERGKTPSLGPG